MKYLSLSKAHTTFVVVILIATLSLIFTACAPASLSASASDGVAASDPNHSAAIETNGAAADDTNVAAGGAAVPDPDHSAASSAQAENLITNAAASVNQYLPMIIAAVVAMVAVLWFRRRRSKA